MSDDYPMGYLDTPIRYPDLEGKEDIARARIEGENDTAHLVPSELDNSIVFSSTKSNKQNISITNITKTKKGNIIIWV